MEKKKTYILDATVLIYDPDIFYKLGDADIVVPLAVVKELDGLKKSDMELTAQAARKVARTLDRWGSYADLITGVKLPTNARIYIYTDYEKIDGLDSQADNRIVGAALKIKREKDIDVVLVTTDTNMRTVARAHGITAESYAFSAFSRGETNVKENYDINSNNSGFIRASFLGKLFYSASKGQVITLGILILLLMFFLKDVPFSVLPTILISVSIFALPMFFIRKRLCRLSAKQLRELDDWFLVMHKGKLKH
jgi:rRNA-processing protein FCF1